MITIDGQQRSDLNIHAYQNLEELLVTVMSDDGLSDRIVTDVFVNNEAFSEIYPHQAEDIETGDISSVEIRTMEASEMAVNIAEELFKVVRILDAGARQVSELFRQADDAEALEMYQDLLDVTRDFLGMISVLRDQYSARKNASIGAATQDISALFSEMLEVTENEDWILLADLLEYEFIPAMERWKQVIAELHEDIRLMDDKV